MLFVPDDVIADMDRYNFYTVWSFTKNMDFLNLVWQKLSFRYIKQISSAELQAVFKVGLPNSDPIDTRICCCKVGGTDRSWDTAYVADTESWKGEDIAKN